MYHTTHTWITRRCISCVPPDSWYETTLNGTLQKWSRVDPFGPLRTSFWCTGPLLRTLFWSGSDRPRGRKLYIGYTYTLPESSRPPPTFRGLHRVSDGPDGLEMASGGLTQLLGPFVPRCVGTSYC